MRQTRGVRAATQWKRRGAASNAGGRPADVASAITTLFWRFFWRVEIAHTGATVVEIGTIVGGGYVEGTGPHRPVGSDITT